METKQVVIVLVFYSLAVVALGFFLYLNYTEKTGVGVVFGLMILCLIVATGSGFAYKRSDGRLRTEDYIALTTFALSMLSMILIHVKEYSTTTLILNILIGFLSGISLSVDA